jgi:chorismate synthase
MSSIFGTLFQISTWGESHGKGLGVVVDGCPAGLELSEEDIQIELDKRKPGQNKLVTPRKEDDKVQILSGVFEGKTTGTPISMVIMNEDQRSHDYGDMVQLYRPSHADLSYDLKYGFRDYRGGGRSSARETAGRVAAGAIAKKVLKELCGTDFLAYVTSIGKIQAQIENIEDVTSEQVEVHPTRCPDLVAADLMEKAILEARKDQDSIGGVIQLVVKNVPIALGEPIFDRLEAKLAMAMLSIPATKGFEMGSGFAGTELRGSEHNDPIYHDGQRFRTTKNDAGGSLGGISFGENIHVRIAFKPTATISQDQDTCDRDGNAAILKAKGRHDPCVVPRAPVIVEAMAAIVLLDLYLLNRSRFQLFPIHSQN